MNKEFLPIYYKDITYIYRRELGNGNILLQNRLLINDNGSFEDVFVEAPPSKIHTAKNAAWDPACIRPLAIVKGYQKSGKVFGKTERKKLLLNSVVPIAIMEINDDVYTVNIQPLGTNPLVFYQSELELIGYEPIYNKEYRFGIGDTVIAKKENRELGIKINDKFVIEQINSSKDNEFYGTILIKRIETGVREIPFTVLPKYFKREKRNKQ